MNPSRSRQLTSALELMLELRARVAGCLEVRVLVEYDEPPREASFWRSLRVELAMLGPYAR